MKNAVLIILALLLWQCKEIPKEGMVQKSKTATSFKETFRPQFHFSPKSNWMNDPNGLVYHDGLYHLFYQYYPGATVWGPMHWGHAVSKDLVRWEHKPIALFPDEKGFIFSGSAVVDKNNTSGFGKDGKVPLVAMFTYFRMDIEKKGGVNTQTQGIAYSLDNGETWEKYADNPVIDNVRLKDFRDPKVFWHEASAEWVMVLVAGDHAKFYTSNNLKEWQLRSTFGENQGAHGGVWECPDLFKLKVEGSDEEKWVLIISIGSGGPNGGSGTQYFVGDFDGTSFVSDQKEFKWLDWGTDNYAGVTYNNTPDDERIFIGWMSNWQYAVHTPTHTWRSAMTLPRKLSLHKTESGHFLKNYPVPQLESIIGHAALANYSVAPKSEKNMVFDTGLQQSEIIFNTVSKDFIIVLENDKEERLILTFDGTSKLVILDRTNSGLTDFQADFGNSLQYMALDNLEGVLYEVRMVLDQSSLELFVDKGQCVMTVQLFPTAPYHRLKIKNTGNRNMELKGFQKNDMATIWENL